MKDRPAALTTKAGIVEIAKRIGVSPSTVSRALRTETAHLVKPERRKEILDLAEQLQFTPNLGARLLRTGGSSTVTVVIPHDENIFFSEYYGRFLSAILHATAGRAWDVHISTLRRASGLGILPSLQQVGQGTSGVLYLGEPLTATEVAELAHYRRPLVLTKSALPADVDVQRLGLPVVGVDNEAGARAAASLLHQLGHRRIGLLLGPEGSRDAQERRAGYEQVLRSMGLEARAEWVFAGPFSPETGRAGFAALFARQPAPTALCCASDEIAFGAIDAARAGGLACPDDLSVVGFDDGPWATACRPALTTVRQPLVDLAERAVSLLIEASNKVGAARRGAQSEMPAPLVIRDSTRAVR